MISSAGTETVSVVSMVGSLHFFLVNTFTAVGLGGTVLMAQYFAKKERKQHSKVCSGTVYGTVFLACSVSILIAVFQKGILQLLFGQAESLVLDHAKIYLLGLLASYRLQAILEGTNGSLRWIGHTKASFKIVFANELCLHCLQYSLFACIRHGDDWVALCCLHIAHQSRALYIKERRLMHIRMKVISKVLKISIPFAADSLFFYGGKIIIQTMIVSFGTNVIATNAIASSGIQILEIIPSALATSLVPIVGQSIGRGNIADAKKFTKAFVLTGMVAFLVINLSLLPFFSYGMRLFNPPAVIVPAIYRLYLIAIVMHFLTWSIVFILPAALRVAGDTNFTTIASLLSI